MHTENFNTEICNAKCSYPWMLYALISIRIVIVLILSVLLISIFYLDNFVPEILSKYIPASKSGISRGIAAFRIFNSSLVTLVLFPFSIICCYLIGFFLKKHEKFLVYVIALTVISYLFFNSLFFKLPIYYIFIFFTMYILILRLNTISPNIIENSKFLRCSILVLFAFLPFIAELIFPSFLILLLRNAKLKFTFFLKRRLWDKIVLYAALGIGANILISAFVFWGMTRDVSQELILDRIFRKAKRIASGNFYGMEIDTATARIFACELRRGLDRETGDGSNQEAVNGADGGLLHIFKLDNISLAPTKIKLETGELQDIIINESRRELYHFDRDHNILLIYDIDSLRLKRRSPIFSSKEDGSARVSYDNKSRTIAITKEGDNMWILDMDTLVMLKQLDAGDRNEYIIFNEKINRYILSYFDKFSTVKLISPDGGNIIEIEAQRYQGGLAVSNKNNELYVALPLRGEIFVYDLRALTLKRKIPTVLGVRGIAYDEKRNIIVAASMCTGYVDVIDLGTDKRISRNFVGYYLREVCLNLQRGEAFISSLFGGIYRLSLKK